MNDKQFEHIIKSKLSGFKPDLTPDWELFLKKKQIADAAIMTPFDNQLKEKLDAYQSPTSPNWTGFLAHKERVVSESEDGGFDEQVKSTLEDYHTDSLPQWDAFSAFRAGLSRGDESFDEGIRAGLEGYESDSQPQWAAFLDYKMDALTHQADNYFDDRIQSELESHVDLSPPQWAAFKTYKEAQTGNEDNFDATIQDKLEGYITDKKPAWSAFLAHKDKVQQGAQTLDFDKQVRAAVAGYVMASAVPQWEAFKKQKTEADAEYQNELFDNQVVSNFDKYTSDSTPQWEAFKKQKAEADAEYQNELFDNQVVTTLDNYTSDSAPQWDKFLDKKRKSDAIYADAKLDSIGQRLGDMKVRYNSEHWLMLKARLENIARLRKQIFSYKTMEMLFVSLLLFTLGNHLYMFVSNKVDKPIAQVERSTSQNESLGTSGSVDESLSSSKSIGTSDEVVQDVAAIEVSGQEDAENVSEEKVNQSSIVKTTNDRISGGGAEGGNNTLTVAPSDEINGAAVVEKDKTSLAKQEYNNNQSELETAVDRSLKKKLDALISSAPLAIAMIGERALREPEDPQPITLREKKTYVDEGNWIHLYNAMTNNYISTPYNTDVGLEGLTHEMYGYAAELLVGKQKGRWEVETGLGYSSLNYTPFDSGKIMYSTATGARSVDFQKINLDFISVPLKMKYHFIANGRWSVFAGLGLNNDIIAKTTYEIVDIKEGGGPIGPDPLPEELPDFYNRTFTSGIFGHTPEIPDFVTYKTKSNNYLLRGNISLGAERNVSDNFAVYIRTTYDQTFFNKDIGPYNDELNKLSFGMGFKLRLK